MVSSGYVYFSSCHRLQNGILCYQRKCLGPSSAFLYLYISFVTNTAAATALTLVLTLFHVLSSLLFFLQQDWLALFPRIQFFLLHSLKSFSFILCFKIILVMLFFFFMYNFHIMSSMAKHGCCYTKCKKRHFLCGLRFAPPKEAWFILFEELATIPLVYITRKRHSVRLQVRYYCRRTMSAYNGRL